MTDPGCTGACCSVFALTHVPDLVARPEAIVDGEQILDMIVPLAPDQARDRFASLGYGDLPGGIAEDHPHTCRHWSGQTRLCGIYATRPAMCSRFPYGRPCPYGCGLLVGDGPPAATVDA